MQNHYLKLAVALSTFIIGLAVVTAWYVHRFEPAGSQPAVAVSPTPSGESEPAAPHDPCAFTRPASRKVSAEEAVLLAECFIIQNGYTDLPPMEDETKLTPESVFPGTDEYGMQMRHDSLERRAYGIAADERYGEGWTVLFRYRNKPDEVEFYGETLTRIGRAVTMDAHGERMRVEHSDQPLNTPGIQRLEH